MWWGKWPPGGILEKFLKLEALKDVEIITEVKKKESLENSQGINTIFLKTTTTTKRARDEENLEPTYQETAKALKAHWLPWKHIYSAFSRWLAEMRLNSAKILYVGSARRVWNLN